VIKKGRAIKKSSPPAKLHRLRIECKKLRYLLEFFSSLYDQKEIGRLVRALKKLQNNLGDFNDFAVQRAALQGIVDDLSSGSRKMPEQTGRAVEHIRRHLEEQQDATRKAFHIRFDAFSAPEVVAIFGHLFGETPG
jgi:CHAD domain-containing protein